MSTNQVPTYCLVVTASKKKIQYIQLNKLNKIHTPLQEVRCLISTSEWVINCFASLSCTSFRFPL